MKIKTSIIALLASAGLSFGAAGIFDSFVFTTTNSGPNVFYDIGAATANPDFNGSNLGIFNSVTDTLRIGGQQKSFKNSGTDVTSHNLWWRTWLISGGPMGTFVQVNMPFQVNLGPPFNPGDQQWGGDINGANTSLVVSPNILASLPNGNYILEVYSRITTNGVNAPSQIFNSNSGNNYRARFIVVPEPSSALLGGLAALTMLRRRRA